MLNKGQIDVVRRGEHGAAAVPEALEPFMADTPLTLVPLRADVIGALKDGGEKR